MSEPAARRVLLVDDDPMVSGVLARVIEMKTPHVVVLPDGLQALAALRDGSFDVVVSDLRMPGASGVEIARFVHGAGLAIEVIIISGFVREADEIAIAEAGARFLRKPFGASELLDELDAAFARLSRRGG